MSKIILPEQTIGIVGGGQLGRMMCVAAKYMGFRVGVLDPTEDAPAAQVADFHIQADYDDEKAMTELAEKSTIITYEFENVDVETLNNVQGKAEIPQGTDLLAITQDRLLEKVFLEENNVIIAPYATIIRASDIQRGLEEVGFPCVLKTTRGGYDGKGQYVIYSMSDVAPAMNLLRDGTCVLEAWIPYEKEISVIVAGNGKDSFTVFPAVENIHRSNILHETIAPARIEQEIGEEAERIALTIAKALKLSGTLCIEMFLTKEGSLYVNELAPRPHNSGHYTIEACSMSQFEAHIRGICGWPLPEVKILSRAVMVNVLGNEFYDTQNFIKDKPDWHFHYYGKKEAKYGRKMGHITILTENVEETLEEIFQTAIWD
ncbi:5-(carboxyamino)imidazole ribonucleotide synthase [Pilibacter termitis]|uniref:N5-carboxyaminoimidazole ribonucleotide synthase n=1 Tax=Pilibacter termitis TaxID=263852 RepID=A0A1T4NVY0_9ENTE|nr:5-(carboxyamino)imidazole ribonucleotide synthase [Pilibacter termitis]